MYLKKKIIKIAFLGALLSMMGVSGFSNGRIAKAESVAGDSMNDVREVNAYSEKAALQQVLQSDEDLTLEERKSMELKDKIVNGTLTQEELNEMLYGTQMKSHILTNQMLSNVKAAGNGLAVNLKVKQYEQPNGYFSGPATTRQTLQYLLNSSPTQHEIAKKLGTTKDGTDGTKIVNYLNKKQKKRTFLISKSTNANDIKSRIVCALNTGVRTPAIGRLKFDKKGSWAYSTNGHFLNISGYNAGMTVVKIVDPNITRIKKGSSGSYTVKFSELQAAIKAHWTHHLYW